MSARSLLLLLALALTACPLLDSDLGWGSGSDSGSGSGSGSHGLTSSSDGTGAPNVDTTTTMAMGPTSGSSITDSAADETTALTITGPVETTTGGVTSASTGVSNDATTAESGSTGGSTDDGGLPDYCQGPVLDYGCNGPWKDELAITVQTELTVPPDASADIEVSTSECGDATRRAAGLVVDVGLESACYWSMTLSIVCPSGQALALTAPGMCDPCSDIANPFHAIFRTTAPLDCTVCDFGEDSCKLRPAGDDLCAFLASCEFPADKPWILRIQTGDSPVTIGSVALRLALAD